MSLGHDIIFLQNALALAYIHRGFCAPNPAVGAVVVKNQEIVAAGYHRGQGSFHAEVDALNKLTLQAAEGATIYVTLEPCCHFGKTPPCTDALIQAGVKRVVYGFRDPNPIVAGYGHAALTAAGIDVEHITLPEIDAFYKSYQHWHLTRKPLLTAKIALSINGKIAGKSGEPVKITGDELREFTHRCRKESDAILTTSKTIIKDDPQLNVRYKNEVIAKPVYILDSMLAIPMTAKILATAQSVTIFHARDVSSELLDRFIAKGVSCIPIDKTANGLALKQVIAFLGKEGLHDIWIEAGGRCFSAFLAEQLLQRAYIYIAPISIPEGLAAFADNVDLNVHADNLQWRQYGKDVLCEIHW
jgi:diaminohydroxyphosphoribosylaminopyrimidine deaminase/5-amino-6-(5-phosphoribosylamino)uracil reductase